MKPKRPKYVTINGHKLRFTYNISLGKWVTVIKYDRFVIVNDMGKVYLKALNYNINYNI